MFLHPRVGAVKTMYRLCKKTMYRLCKLASATLRFSFIFQGGLVSADNAMFSALGGNYNHGRA
jgi:hypothetical protein